MDFNDLSRQIADMFPRLSPQLQRAAHHVLQRPDDVALKSMRKVAADAEVHPSTMVRLARAFDFESYTGFREPFQQRLRLRPTTYLDRARDLQECGAGEEASILLRDVVTTHGANLRECFEINGPDTFLACADALSEARRIFVVGVRGYYPVAFFFHYVYRMFRPNSILIDGRGATLIDDLRVIDSDDVILAISVHPYSYESVKAVEYAKKRGATTVVVTDSLVSPLVESGDNVLIANDKSPSFFHSVAPAMAVVESLIVLMVARGGEETLCAIEDSERHLREVKAYWNQSVKPTGKSLRPRGPRSP
ncbi:MAG: MurR/RpiR family transcriptional regulator [Rhodospirillales bacterium]|jgi:DNA-binding MurR/RpiR family transcriptional regulator|nr:MurR/RpiR family transcriptional regulator [Rhodospirillales bacterium]